MLRYLLSGGWELSAHICHTETIMNMCMRHHLVYIRLRLDRKTDRVRFLCTPYTAGLIMQLCRSVGIRLTCDRQFGLPHIIHRYRKRYGIAVGAVIALAIVMISGQYIWDVRVSGNVRLSEDEVVTALEEQGLGVGSRISRLDVDSVENRLLIDSREISWVAVNLEGSVAMVEIRERLPEPIAEPTAPANLVATRDGRIEQVEAYDGEVLVRAGQYVSRGELLVSGIVDSASIGWRYIRARGVVMARTLREIHVEIPMDYSEKNYTGKKRIDNSLIFFGKNIKLYKNTGFLDTTYDTICNVDRCCLFGDNRLPLWFCRTEYLEYVMSPARRTDEQAMELAYDELDAQIDQLTAQGATLLRKDIICQPGEAVYKLDCTLMLIENIAGTVEFQISELMEDR